MSNFAKVFRLLREKSNMTQEQLAKALGISRSAVGMYERGVREPDYDLLEAIADFFNVDVNYLLGKQSGSTYYLDPETARVAQEIFDDRDLRALFDAGRGASPQDLKMAADLLRRLKATNPDG